MVHLQRGNLSFLRQPKVNKVKFALPFLKFMKRPRTRFNANAMTHSRVIRSKKVKISKCVATQFFSVDRLFITATTTDVDTLLQV